MQNILMLALVLTAISCRTAEARPGSSELHVSGGNSIDLKSHVCRKEGMTAGVLPGLFSLTVNDDGTTTLDLLRITDSSAQTNYDKLHVSPNGSRIVYLECKSDFKGTNHAVGDCFCDRSEYTEKRLVVSDLDGSNRVVVSEGFGLTEYPNWSPKSDAVVFIQTTPAGGENSNAFDTELYAYKIASGQRYKLTDMACRKADEDTTDLTTLPYCMVSDNFWNADGSIVVIQNKIAWRDEVQPNGSVKRKPRIAAPNNIFRFTPNFSTPVTKLSEALTNDADFFVAENGGESSHCCSADPRISPDLRYLAYPHFNRADPTFKEVSLVLRDLRDGSEVDLTRRKDVFDGYPMFNSGGDRLLWTRYKPRRDASGEPHSVTSIATASLADGVPPLVIEMVGDGIQKHKLGDVEVDFWLVRWPDWLHGQGRKIIFPGVIKATDSNGELLPELEQEILRRLARGSKSS